MSSEVLNTFKVAAKNYDEDVQQWKKTVGGKAIGFLLTDVPEELIHAAGFFPFGISGGNTKMDVADAHLQFWACSFVRSSLAMALEGKLDFLDGLIIPHTCDTTRMVLGIWKHAKPLPLMDNFRLPKQVERPSAHKYLVGEISRFKKLLEDFRGSEITDEELWQSIRLYNSNRELLRRLFFLHEKNPDLLSNRNLYTIIKSSMIMSREKVNKLLQELLNSLEEEEKTSSSGNERSRIVLSGTILEPMDLLDYFEESGGVIVADDLQNGFRYIESDVPENGDPLEALASRQRNRIPSAAYDLNKNPRRDFLVNLAREKQADGVILLHLKYCEPENYDYYDNYLALETAGIPAMRIETEFGGVALGQLRTRVQAFMEMVGGGSSD